MRVPRRSSCGSAVMGGTEPVCCAHRGLELCGQIPFHEERRGYGALLAIVRRWLVLPNPRSLPATILAGWRPTRLYRAGRRNVGARLKCHRVCKVEMTP